jgi:hypothetical protein
VGIVGVAQNLKGRDLAWSWFLSNWELIRIYYDIIVSDISMPGVSSAISVIIKVSSKSAVLVQIHGVYLALSCPLEDEYDPSNFNIFYLKI